MYLGCKILLIDQCITQKPSISNHKLPYVDQVIMSKTPYGISVLFTKRHTVPFCPIFSKCQGQLLQFKAIDDYSNR